MTLDQATALLQQHGIDVEPHGYFAGGEVGAADVRSSTGTERYVLKWWEGSGEDARRSADLVEKLRAREYPAPRFVLADEFDGFVFMLQEFVEGEARDLLTSSVVRRLIGLIRSQRGVASLWPGSHETFAEYVDRSLVEGCEGFCLHEPLRDYSAETRRLLTAVRAAAGAASGAPTTDIVHVDFHHRNVLQADGDVAAVIDWEGCRDGDASFDLVTLLFGLSVADVPESARDAVREELETQSEAAHRHAYAAHMALRQVDWSIRHRTAADVEHWLRVSREYLTL